MNDSNSITIITDYIAPVLSLTFRLMYLINPLHSNHYPHKKMLKSFEEDHHRETAWW